MVSKQTMRVWCVFWSPLLFVAVVGTIACKQAADPMPLPPPAPGLIGGCSPELIDAVHSHDSASIKRLRLRGAKGSCPELMKELFQAIADDNLKQLPTVLEAGTDPNGAYGDWCNPPLALAYQIRAFSYRDGRPEAKRGTGVLAILLKNGADPNGRWAPGCGGIDSELWIGVERITPLMIATVAGDRAFVKLLIAAGADVTAEDTKGGTALYYGQNSGLPSRSEIVALLSR